MSKYLLAGLLTVLFESITLLFRFVFGLQSTRDTAFIQYFTFGFRIHHGYVGAILMLVAWQWPGLFGRFGDYVWSFGLALILSDLIHHFIVLWWFTGDPSFDLRYPD